MQQVDIDVLIAGSGGGGLVAALAATLAGQRVLVVEKLPTLGGTTAISGGAIWIPDNPVMHDAGQTDSLDAARTYIDGLIDDFGPATSDARKSAYLREGPRMIELLRRAGVRLVYCKNYPDYYASRPGGSAHGRSVESAIFNGRKIGADYKRLNRRPLLPSLAPRAQDLPGLSNGTRTWRDIRTVLALAWNSFAPRLIGQAPLSMGAALVGQLLYALRGQRMEIWTSAPVTQLTRDANGRVSGAIVTRDGTAVEVRAARGVLLASGGFAHNQTLRDRHHPAGSAAVWSSSPAGDQGDAVALGEDVGAGFAQMDQAWWMPSFKGADGKPVMCAYERAKPHSIIVDQLGERFCNEGGSYMEVGQRIFGRQRIHGRALPCWLVLDSRHRRRYPLGTWMPGMTPRSAVDAGLVVKADSLDELAQRCGIDVDGLRRTLTRFHQACANGRDPDFQRGDDPYDRFYGDPRVKPNPCLGSIERAPFYAVAIYPGDIGTCGGLLTDEHARVLSEDGSVIDGLYATGNCTAGVMGNAYPGAGATIGPSMVFGFIAARHAATGRQ